jgi:hypothetical protein
MQYVSQKCKRRSKTRSAPRSASDTRYLQPRWRDLGVIEQLDATALLFPAGDRVTVDDAKNLIVEVKT